MRNRTCLGVAFITALIFMSGFPLAFGQETSTQSKSSHESSVVNSSASISVKTENGKTTVTYNGKDVFKGSTKGRVSAKASSENNVEYAAAFDDKKVIWENVPGAANHVKMDDRELNLSTE